MECSREALPGGAKQATLFADQSPHSVDVCDLPAGIEVGCSVAAFTSNNQTFNRGPFSGSVAARTHVNCKFICDKNLQISIF